MEHFKGNPDVFVLSEQFQFTFDWISYVLLNIYFLEKDDSSIIQPKAEF